MFDPEGWLPLPYIVAWLAKLGSEGRLPRGLGFAHPGDEADALNLPAEATSRHVLGEKLAANTLTAWMFVEPARRWVELRRADYWTSDSAAQTMKIAKVDLSFFGLDNDVQQATVFLNVENVAAVLGFRLAPMEATAVAQAAPSTTLNAAPAGPLSQLSASLPAVPPEWVALSDLPGWIARWYGVSMTVVAPDVADAVWTGELYPWHRIAGIKPDGWYRRLPDGLTGTGVMPIHDPRPDAPFEGRIVAYDWAAAGTDRRKGTVGGWPQKSGVRERLLIELPWVAVKDWASPRVKRWKQEASEDRAAPAGADAHPAEAQTRARRPAYSPEALAAWFVLRAGTWPRDVRPPTEVQCRKAASDYFEGSIPRDKFREIRRAKTPDNWRKPGPPSGR